MQWHTMAVPDVLKNLESSERGLETEEVDLRLKEYGQNRISTEKKRTGLIIFLEQFRSFLVILLVFATLLSIILGMLLDALAIGMIVLLNAFLGFYQERKAEKAIDELKKLIVSKTTVIRDGEYHEVQTDSLVPGDVVLLEEGNRVPADMRLIEVVNLKVDESMLTGESSAVSKDVKPLSDVPLPDRKNMVFTGTLVSCGRGRAVVVSTGMATEMGKIAGLVQQREEETPLQIKLQRFGKNLGMLVAILAVAIFIIGLMRSEDPYDMFFTAMSLAISAVPEGLPAVVTLTLSLGTQKMLRRNSAVKRLSAVEALGSVTVICADKTGTMTTNEMTVRKIWVPGKSADVTGVGFEPHGDFVMKGRKFDPANSDFRQLIEMADACNDSVIKKELEWKIIGDPTEGALKVLARKARVSSSLERCREIPFSSERKMMTTIHKKGKFCVAYTKGAPEHILNACARIGKRKLDSKEKEEILRAVHKMASEGLRVLAFSYKDLKEAYKLESVEKDMTLVGLVAMIDPPRKETKESISLCKKAGIKVVMITGDHKLTAKSIASEVGLSGKIVTGEEMNLLTDQDLSAIIDDVAVFARVSPQDKLRIVDVLRRKGHIVAMTGDGVNDAPALKRSEVGIAVGMKGTDVAKEAADMILLDDNFSTIVHAVKEGRRIYDNIKKFVKFLLSTNFGEIFLVIASMLSNLPLPLIPIQILWINLITDSLPALSLGVEPAEKDVMSRKPRNPKESILSSSLGFILLTSFMAFLVSFCMFLWDMSSGAAAGLDAGFVEKKARTMAFMTLIFFELFFVFNCRFEKKSVFTENVFGNLKLVAAFFVSITLQGFVIYVPILQQIFETVPLGAFDWARILGFSLLGFFVFPEIFASRRTDRKV